MAITDYHKAIFDFLENYRSKHPEAHLTYSLRRNNKVSRPKNIYLFTGNEGYIFVGLYAPHNGNNKTRSIGFSCSYDSGSDTIKKCSLEIAYNDPKLDGHQEVYEKIIHRIGSDKFQQIGIKKFQLHYSASDWQNNLLTYLEQHKPVIDQVIKETGNTKIFKISREELEEDIKTINEMPPPIPELNYWVFQGNPDKFHTVDALQDNKLQSWRVAAHLQKIKQGDKVILWVSGSKAGCYALAQVDSEIYIGVDEEGEKYYQTLQSDKEPTERVKLKVLLNLWDRPVTKEDLQGLPAFNQFNGGNQGTNFTATREQFEAIEQLARPDIPSTKRRYWKYLPGDRQASQFQDNLQNQEISIVWTKYHTGPLNVFTSQADLDESLGKSPGVSNETWNMILFKDAAIGDIVFANQGLNTVVGIGVINGSYQYQDGEPEQHRRSVNWLADKPWQYTPYQFSNRKNLFRPDSFTPTLVGPEIIQEYLKRYPEYRSIFEKNSLIEDKQSDEQPMAKVDSKYPKNIILYGPPGTGKTYETIDLAVKITDGLNNNDHLTNKKRFDQLRKEGQIEFITFHQNYTYEDFVTGLKPATDGGDLKFEQRYGVFYRMAKLARDNYSSSQVKTSSSNLRPFQEVFDEFMKPLVEDEIQIDVKMASGIVFYLYDLSERSISFQKHNGSTIHTLSITTLREIYEGTQEVRPNGLKPYYKPISEELAKLGRKPIEKVPLKNYVLIIDEINRANMSRVFGELITLLEDDKRLGGDNELTVTLPSGELFSVPPNLYLIGTMNTADKSLALLDIALRRRFEFIVKNPNYNVLNEPAKGLLQKLNRSIVKHKKSADFQIGHAYFINKPTEQIDSVLDNRIIPLLMEYFNGRTDLVETILKEAEISFTKDDLTLQLEAKYGAAV